MLLAEAAGLRSLRQAKWAQAVQPETGPLRPARRAGMRLAEAAGSRNRKTREPQATEPPGGRSGACRTTCWAPAFNRGGWKAGPVGWGLFRRGGGGGWGPCLPLR
ncbi:hypothetical protein Ssi02_33160 [Sinosporangium siamense]|uniref:Uncharacterized protein n=1 Tax=Sinosporangium siamense TaxID=1367973 RepID=A0A919RFR7_9ACTN|nr:hypothetical protein Ssi02_33160 [Sinosporangium siamense]